MTQALEDTLIGRDVGDGFVITRLLGEGGMGGVYLAENRALGKKIGFKVLLPEFSEHPQMVARFIDEARAACATPHPNIIDVLGNGRLEDGRHYFKMEFLEGKDLGAYCKEWGPLATDTALQILAQVCAALDAVHRKGIVHRDLKPANIFVSPTDENLLRTKLLDFGIAKLSGAEIGGSVKTGSKFRAGTPGYWSPEQARATRDVDHRADIFALGVITYEMLTGMLPETVHPPDPRSYRPDLNEGWVRAVEAAMALDPGHRPATIREFVQQLIDATENGAELAEKAAPSLYVKSTPDDMTMKQPGSGSVTPVVGAPSTAPPVFTQPQPTTLGGAAAESVSARAESSAPWARWALVGGLVATLGVAGLLIGLRNGSEAEDVHAQSTRDARVGRQVDASVPTPVEIAVTSEPSGAAVFIEGNAKPEGVTPFSLRETEGVRLRLRAKLDGHKDAAREFPVAIENRSVHLVLQAIPTTASSSTAPRTEEPRPAKKRTKKRRKAPAKMVKPASPKPEPPAFPTHGVGGN